MAKFYNIEKDGIANVIDEYQYDAIYKPMGWVGRSSGMRAAARKIRRPLRRTKRRSKTKPA